MPVIADHNKDQATLRLAAQQRDLARLQKQLAESQIHGTAAEQAAKAAALNKDIDKANAAIAKTQAELALL